jgi:hypothetical protein
MSWRNEWEELRQDPETRSWVVAEEAKHSVAANLYRLRKAAGMSQAQLASEKMLQKATYQTPGCAGSRM